MKRKTGLKLSFSTRDDGMLETAYIQFREGDVAETRELQGNVVLGDYDKQGRLLGIEILAPVPFVDLEKYADASQRDVLRHIAEKRVSDLVGCGNDA